jgi:hypothetical protein
MVKDTYLIEVAVTFVVNQRNRRVGTVSDATYSSIIQAKRIAKFTLTRSMGPGNDSRKLLLSQSSSEAIERLGSRTAEIDLPTTSLSQQVS